MKHFSLFGQMTIVARIKNCEEGEARGGFVSSGSPNAPSPLTILSSLTPIFTQPKSKEIPQTCGKTKTLVM